jgi:hypothetical protein
MVGTVPKLLIKIAFTSVLAYVASYYIPWWISLFLWNSAFGLIVLFQAWSLIPRFLKANEDRDCLFPAFRRLDRQYWSFWMFVPGAMTFYTFRILFAFVSIVLKIIILYIVMIGHKWGKDPFTGIKYYINFYAYKIVSFITVTMSGTRMRMH